MVHRKQPRDKPKDLVVLADEDSPGAGQVRSRGGPGGGVRTALTPLPNYMRPTSCSGAKAGRASRTEPPPPPPSTKREQLRAKVVFARPPPHASRATCSSSMKGPFAAAAGPATAHVCSYAYCSFKDHVRASVVPLNTFVASRRRLIKTQQSMKLKGASPFRKPNKGGGSEGYFVEIHAGAGAGDAAPVVGSDVSCGGVSTEEMVRRMEKVMFDHLSFGEEAEDKANCSGASSADDSCGSSVVISDGSLEVLGSTKNRGREGKETLVVDQDHEDDCFGACKSDISDDLDVEHEGNIPPRDVGGDGPEKYSSDGLSSSSAHSGISFEDVSSDCPDAATSQRRKLHISRRRESEEEGSKQMRPFKPKAPNFLPVETGPETEKVDLRHQEANDRRGAEEWMVDYALRKAVKKLARVQKRKVEMLVQAFETVLPTGATEKETVQHEDDKKNGFPLSRTSQARS